VPLRIYSLTHCVTLSLALCDAVVVVVVVMVTVVGPGRWHSCHRWEDDVWSATEGTGSADVRRPAQEWSAQEVLIVWLLLVAQTRHLSVSDVSCPTSVVVHGTCASSQVVLKFHSTAFVLDVS